ncbi:hypothetical protein [Thalassotalea fusca]
MTDTLFVPMDVQALLVNDEVRKGQNFQRWQADYGSLNHYISPTPKPFSGTSEWNEDPKANGIYLKWTLPHALRTGKHTQNNAETKYSLVPNRWLVVRHYGDKSEREAKAWVVESDFLDPENATSPYIDPKSKEGQATYIGKKVDLNYWQEVADQDLFLTAIGPDDLTFSVFQPSNENVFSIHDPLSDVPEQDVISYLVVGWYSDPTKDILADVADQEAFREKLRELNWRLDNTTGTSCALSIYHGFVHSIQWDKNGEIPISERPTKVSLSSPDSEVSLAVGNSAIDALTALITQQAKSSEQPITPRLLEAFQYNLLPLLDLPQGEDLLNQAIHKAWFGSYPGGYEWIVVKKTNDERVGNDQAASVNTSADWTDPYLHPAWLDKLNQTQASYDEKVRELHYLQWQLYCVWWTKGKYQNLSGIKKKYLGAQYSEQKFEGELNVNKANSLAQKVQIKLDELTKLLSRLPKDNELEVRSNSLVTSNMTLPNQNYQLKRIPKAPFYKANDPVVLISGSKASGTLTDDKPLRCRLLNQLISGVKLENTEVYSTALKNSIPSLDLSRVPSQVTLLLQEAFFLDPNNSSLIATQVESRLANSVKHDPIGVRPDFSLDNWQQPWSPLFLMWEAYYYPIKYKENKKKNWEFCEQEYHLSDNNLSESKHITLSGTTLLTPKSQFNFKRRLEAFIAAHPELDAKELSEINKFISETDHWDFLSQSLDGFMYQLICREHERNTIPTSDCPIAKLVGEQLYLVPELGDVSVPFYGFPQSKFQQCRGGQFCFEKLLVVDSFGQSIELSTSLTYLENKQIVIAPSIKAKFTVSTEEAYRFIQLPPRLLQPARLNFDFVCAESDEYLISLNGERNPVCAWIIPNHIDKTLACYDAEGKALGALGVISLSENENRIHWIPAPNSIYTSIERITSRFPHLGQMLTGLIEQGADAYYSFYQTIDETLWSIDPLGARSDQNLSVLAGRPLALVRARLKYELDGPAVTDPSWRYVFEPANVEFTEYEFPVKLGQLKLQNDGLLGYFLSSDYSTFNCVQLPPEVGQAPAYLKQIKKDNLIDLSFDKGSEAFISMLIDPRASVHATNHILPDTTLALPEKYVQPALSAMEIMIHAGPLLATEQVMNSVGNTAKENVLTLIPKPAETNGEWRWLQHEDGVWNDLAIKHTNAKANFSNLALKLQTGILKLSNSIKTGE